MNKQSSVGIDIIYIPEFSDKYKRLGFLFLKRIFCEKELHEANNNIDTLAGKFACKEAFVKTLSEEKFSLKDIQVLKKNDKPYIIYKGIKYHNISISHSYHFAIAIVIKS